MMRNRGSRSSMYSQTSQGGEKPYWYTKLEIKISEAKQLPSKDINGYSDPYCVVCVDKEVVARTSTQFKTLDPFFGETMLLNLNSNFSSLSIYMYDQDRVNDDVIGKVDFDRQQLKDDKTLATDKWYPLTKVTKETDVWGEVFIELLKSETQHGLEILTVTVVKARDLRSKESSGRCDPFAIVKVDEERIQTDKDPKTRSPYWDKFFTFRRGKLGPEISVTIRNGAGLGGGSTFMGEAVIPVGKLSLDIPTRAWYSLKPRWKDLDGMSEGNGSIRLALSFSQELILPAWNYDKLTDFVAENSTSQELLQHGPIALLEDILSDRDNMFLDREQVARILMRTLLLKDKGIEYLQHICGLEIAQATDGATLFRGNSMATKSTDQFMKIVGLKYLHETLKPLIDDIFKEKKDCEIDPMKMKKNSEEQMNKHTQTLIMYVQKLLNAIFSSAEQCPTLMSHVFRNLREEVAKSESLTESGQPVSYTVVSGFLFLRFFAPAVLSPNLFGIREELADARTKRTLTLLAKCLQAVGNLGSTIGSGKESYMEVLHPIIIDHLDSVKNFIDKVCDVKETPAFYRNISTQGSDLILLHGAIPCRSESGGALGSTFKKRIFALTSRYLTCEKQGDPASQITLEMPSVKSVELLDASAFDKKHVVRIETDAEIGNIYLHITNKWELNAWIQALRKACRSSGAEIEPAAHSGIYRKGAWTCCRSKDKKAVPCSKTHSAVAVDKFTDHESQELWAHRLFALFMAGKGMLEAKYSATSVLSPQEEPKRVLALKLFDVLDDVNLAHLLSQESLTTDQL